MYVKFYQIKYMKIFTTFAVNNCEKASSQSVKRVHWDKSQPAKREHFTAVFTMFFFFLTSP